MEPRIITGLGICSAIGIGREAFFHALEKPTPLSDLPREPIESFDASKYPDDELANLYAQEQARFYLEHVDDLFL